jgi:hypothetical protein
MEEHYWAIFHMPLATVERYWALFYMALVTEEHYWALLQATVYVFTQFAECTGTKN